MNLAMAATRLLHRHQLERSTGAQLRLALQYSHTTTGVCCASGKHVSRVCCQQHARECRHCGRYDAVSWHLWLRGATDHALPCYLPRLEVMLCAAHLLTYEQVTLHTEEVSHAGDIEGQHS